MQGDHLFIGHKRNHGHKNRMFDEHMINRVFWLADLLVWRSVAAPKNSGRYQDCPTELYFEDGHPTYKIKFSGAVLVAS